MSGAKERMHTVHEILVEDYLKTTYPDVDFVIMEGPRSLRDDMLFEFVIRIIVTVTILMNVSAIWDSH